ncbi:antitoxin Xre/MbcA/ParS toxin-binding domain-containing protein [Vibrio sp. 10N.222.51.C12]|uniref:antitoxin Xre/MbcA/ParS toxin-binding domain-containing protein n=1 Tax=Vibrio sp. 10N.222.51.C12 TaxID=3229622 RepID=UPI003551F976
MNITHVDDKVREELLKLFNDDEKMADEWLTAPKRILNGLSPFEVLNTEQGKAKVLDMIQRIKLGDFS